MMAPIFRQDFSPLHTNIQMNIFLTENSILSGNFIKIGGRRRQRESFFEFSAHFQHWSLLTTSFWIFQINSCQIKSNRQNDSTVLCCSFVEYYSIGSRKTAHSKQRTSNFIRNLPKPNSIPKFLFQWICFGNISSCGSFIWINGNRQIIFSTDFIWNCEQIKKYWSKLWQDCRINGLNDHLIPMNEHDDSIIISWNTYHTIWSS